MNSTTKYNNKKLNNTIIAIYQQSIANKKNTINHFPIIAPDKYVDMSRIYPTKQQQIKNILLEIRNDTQLKSLHLFGSSITMLCNKDSDIDLAIEINELSNKTRNEISEKIQLACNWNADIIWMDHLSKNDRIYKDIMNGLKLI